LRKVTCCLFNSALGELYSGARDRNLLVWDSDSASDASSAAASSRKRKRDAGAYAVLSATGRAADAWSDDEG
jgi:hypothetical protein